MNAASTGTGALTRSLLRCGVLAGPTFLTTATLEGARRTDYHPARHPMSSLALGPRGWVQTTNFALTGSLLLLGASGLWRSNNRMGAAVSAIAGGALLVSAVCPTDPVSNYPAGTPGTPETRTKAGLVHDVSSIPIFLGLPVAQLAHGLRNVGRDPAWAAYSAGSAVAMVAGFVGASAGFSQSERWVPYGGVLQRVAAASGLGWLTALCARTLRSTAPS